MRHAHIPYQEVTDMHLWQLCHLAMVVPIADAYYESDDPEKVEKEWKIMRKTAERPVSYTHLDVYKRQK